MPCQPDSSITFIHPILAPRLEDIMPRSLDSSRRSIVWAGWVTLPPGSGPFTSGPKSLAHHPGSTTGFEPATAPASLLTEVFSGDTQKACKLTTRGDNIAQSEALERVTKTGTELLLAKEIYRVIQEGREDYLEKRWLASQCDNATAATKAEYELTKYEHKTAVDEAKEAGCTQQSVDDAKALAQPPGKRNGIATSIQIYYDMARYPLAASGEGGSGGGTENVRRERSVVYQEGSM
jgi:hypothetical protein